MTSKGQNVAQIALAHVGCSATLKVDVYTDVIVRPVDREAKFVSFYYRDRSLSTCALEVVGCWRLAGCVEPECVASYFPAGGVERDAMVDIENLARRFGAWVTPSASPPPIAAGDAWIIDSAGGNDAHTGVAVGDLVVEAAGLCSLDTVEGGQAADVGSTGTGAFTRTLRLVGGRWMMGARYLIGWARAEALPLEMPTATELPPDPHDDPTGLAT